MLTAETLHKLMEAQGLSIRIKASGSGFFAQMFEAQERRQLNGAGGSTPHAALESLLNRCPFTAEDLADFIVHADMQGEMEAWLEEAWAEEDEEAD